jgi:hypothetical protein
MLVKTIDALDNLEMYEEMSLQLQIYVLQQIKVALLVG